jgi:CheY-like chemotaxis protein/anti-sigma regulatory factor (Ser/Thr protein kinase)
VAEAAREVARMLAPRIEEREQRLALAIDDDAPRAMADPARVRQVLTNLLTNAHLYTPEGGRIEVRVTGVDDWVELAVADDGRGMTAEQLEHVFERFYRGGADAAPSTPRQPGTGLGLAIVQSLVELQGGTIDIASTPGEGSTFTVRLPAVEPAVETPGRRVLVVEGDVAAAAAIVAELDARGVAAVVEAERGAVLARLRAERFDAMTLDVLVDDAGGFELLRTVRAEPRLKRLPIVLVSGLAGSPTLSGEWVVDRPDDPGELADSLTDAVLALIDARVG